MWSIWHYTYVLLWANILLGCSQDFVVRHNHENKIWMKRKTNCRNSFKILCENEGIIVNDTLFTLTNESTNSHVIKTCETLFMFTELWYYESVEDYGDHDLGVESRVYSNTENWKEPGSSGAAPAAGECATDKSAWLVLGSDCTRGWWEERGQQLMEGESSSDDIQVWEHFLKSS